MSDSELVACCIWEDARESATLIKATKSTVRQEGTSRRWERTPAALDAISRLLKLPSDHRAPMYQLMAVFDGRPWVELQKDQRRFYSSLLPREVTALRLAFMEELAALTEANQNIPKENIECLRKQGIPEPELRGNLVSRGARNCADPVRLTDVFDKGSVDDWRKGCSVLAVTVDFAHYNDAELCDAFREMIKSARPVDLKRPKRTPVFAKKAGRKRLEWRVALERLAVARLVKCYGPNPERFPKVARSLYRRRVHDRLGREIKEADQFFRKLFPSLPAEERMESRTKAITVS